MIFNIIDKKTNLKILLMGDATINTERLYMQDNDIANYHILKIGHHGSKTSSGRDFNSKSLFFEWIKVKN